MSNIYTESFYSLIFRQEDAKKLGEHLRLRHCVELIGMKRVGISNFLRFFLYHPNISQTYINHGEKHLFIPVDLNDLVQTKIFAFWILVFKRLADSLDHLSNHQKTKEAVNNLFLSSIQSQNLFLTIENMKKALAQLVNLSVYPTFFLIRFDRFQPAITDEFFANLQGLIEASNQKLSYVFTSFRTLDQISPRVFPRQALLVFSHIMYIKPASLEDMKIIYQTFQTKYQLPLTEEDLKRVIKLSGGHVQYLQLSLIILNEKIKEMAGKLGNWEAFIFQDERINLQSEEIWDSLNKDEQIILKKILGKVEITAEDKQKGKYLWETGIVLENQAKLSLFSPLFEYYLQQNHHPLKTDKSVELTKKENRLFEVLKEKLDQVCEREEIINQVWPEYEELGVSNWTVDRLVARLREKLKKQQNSYQIITVKTRGYKLAQM